jgi:outer membrane lipoprotein-sorting protein
MSAAEILKRNRTAMGLSLTEAKIASTVASGTIEISGLPGTVEIYSKAPDRQLMIVNLKGFGQVIESFDGTEAWSQDPLSGFRLKDGSELVQTKEASLFDRDAQLVKLYPKLVVRGIGKVNGRDAYVVEATSSTDRAETWHFDTESFLLVKQDTVVDTPQGKFPVETYLEDYRLVNGVRIAFSNRAVTSAQTVVMRFTEIKTNVAIDDARFAKPTAP